MNKENLEKAGEIARKIKKEIPKLVIVGNSYKDVAETVESMIMDEGAKPAFPVNISVNEVAAHYTPSVDEDKEFGEEDLVKVDFGVWVDDAITDTAITIDLAGRYNKLITTVEEALEKALKAIKPGVTVGEVGEIIEKEIRKNGFKPISNLTGHKIEPLLLHAGVEIPNIKTKDPYEFSTGEVFACEPFATLEEGAGYVKETEEVSIFSLFQPRQPRMRHTRKLLMHIIQKYKTMPFAERWVQKEMGSKLLLHSAIKEMLKDGTLEAYPVLVEANKMPVAQAEATFIVEEEGVRRMV